VWNAVIVLTKRNNEAVGINRNQYNIYISISKYENDIINLYVTCLHVYKRIWWVGFYSQPIWAINSFQKALIGWKIAGPEKLLVFEHVNRLILFLVLIIVHI